MMFQRTITSSFSPDSSPATSYSYRITHDTDGRTKSATFRTLPLPGGTVKAAVLGDSGQYGPDQDEVIRRVASSDPHG
jgi:hypothetical protein